MFNRFAYPCSVIDVLADVSGGSVVNMFFDVLCIDVWGDVSLDTLSDVVIGSLSGVTADFKVNMLTGVETDVVVVTVIAFIFFDP